MIVKDSLSSFVLQPKDENESGINIPFIISKVAGNYFSNLNTGKILNYKDSPIYLSILDENISMKNKINKIINDTSKLSIMSLRERGLRTFSGISPARYRSAKDSQEFPLSPMPFNTNMFASSSSSYTSPIRYDKNGNYINNKNNYDDDIRQSSNYNNYYENDYYSKYDDNYENIYTRTDETNENDKKIENCKNRNNGRSGMKNGNSRRNGRKNRNGEEEGRHFG